jgi:hypothetical protein
MDTKLAGFFGVGTALVGVIAALFAIKPDAFKAGGFLALAMAVLLYAALAVICIIGMRVRLWDIGPEMEDIYNDYTHYDEAEIKWRATFTLLQRHFTNKGPYDSKTAMAKSAPLLLVILAGLTVATTVYVAVQG